MRFSRGAWIGLLLVANRVVAADGTTFGAGTNQSSAVPAVSFDGFANVIITTIALLIFVGVGLYLLKNGTMGLRRQSGGDRKLQVLETRMLGSRQFLIVVQYDDSKVLLGVTPGKIDYLCPLESRTEVIP